MAKIRPLHPEFFTDDEVCSLSPLARLLYQGLWCLACDKGHVEDKSRQIKRRVLPDDNVNANQLLDEIAGTDLATRENGWITIKAIHRWKIDPRFLKTCDYPGCKEPERKTRRVPSGGTAGTQRAPGVDPTGTRRAPADDVDVDVESDGDGDGETRAKPRQRSTVMPKDWTPNPNHQTIAKDNRLDLAYQAIQFTEHHAAKGTTFKNWDMAFNTWLRKAAEYGGRTNGSARPQRDLPDARRLVSAPDGGLSAEEYAVWFAEQRAAAKADA